MHKGFFTSIYPHHICFVFVLIIFDKELFVMKYIGGLEVDYQRVQ